MYAQLDDMIRQLGRREVLMLADPEQTGEIDQVIIDDALVSASAEIDSYLAGRYRLPLAHVPRNMTRIACDIARYHLTGNDRLETEAVRERYKAAVRFLELAAAGKITLGATDMGDTPTPAGSVQFVTGQKVFGRSGPGAY